MSTTKPACSPATAELFYSTNPFSQQKAKNICASCPLLSTCQATSADEKYGVWAGLTAEERGFRPDGTRFRRPSKAA